MAKGKVKWFNTAKGYGFIEPESGGADIFVHVSAIQESGLETLAEDQAIEFEMIEGKDGREMAGNISIS
jgi:CspA family cold shock protein